MNVLAVGCHPDDIEIGCGGTLAKYSKAGHRVVYCHVATGSKGHAVIMPEELIKIRHAEVDRSCEILGAEHISLGIPDLMVDSKNEDLVRDMVDVIRYVRPDIIITHSPDDYMRDHVETSRLVFNASFASSVVHYKTEHEVYGTIAPIYYMDTLAGMNFEPTEYVDISEEIETKISALACHESQIVWMLEHDNIDFLDFVRTCSKFRGYQSGATYAEGFRPCNAWPRMVAKRLLP